MISLILLDFVWNFSKHCHFFASDLALIYSLDAGQNCLQLKWRMKKMVNAVSRNVDENLLYCWFLLIAPSFSIRFGISCSQNLRMHLHQKRFKRASLVFGNFIESFAIGNYKCLNPFFCVTKSKVINLDELLTGIRPVQAIIFEQIEMNDLCVRMSFSDCGEKIHIYSKLKNIHYGQPRRQRYAHAARTHRGGQREKPPSSAEKPNYKMMTKKRMERKEEEKRWNVERESNGKLNRNMTLTQ